MARHWPPAQELRLGATGVENDNRIFHGIMLYSIYIHIYTYIYIYIHIYIYTYIYIYIHISINIYIYVYIYGYVEHLYHVQPTNFGILIGIHLRQLGMYQIDNIFGFVWKRFRIAANSCDVMAIEIVDLPIHNGDFP